MKKHKIAAKSILIICITLIVIYPSYTMSWYEDGNQYPIQAFSTTKWLAYEALQLATKPYKYQWLTNLWGNHLDAFFSGIAAPRDRLMATGYANTNDYGDISDLRLFLDETGTIVTENNLSVRAQVEYEKLVNELNQTEPDDGLCAFYAGTTAHYISQAGTWGVIWNESTSWGSIASFQLYWSTFESQIETGIATNYAMDPIEWWTQDEWNNTYFNLSPTVGAPKNASEATIQLAKNIHPLAEDLGKNFTSHILIDTWTAIYLADVQDCLEYSVEAIFSFLQNALIEVNWKYIDIPITSSHYDNETGLLFVDEFQVNYTDISDNTFILNDSQVTKAKLKIGIFPDLSEGLPTLSPDDYDLEFNPGTEKWYFPSTLLNGTVANTLHKVYYVFDMIGTIETWSAGNETFFVDYFYVEFTSFSYQYNSADWSLDIFNVKAICEITEIGIIDPTDVSEAEWVLYFKAEGAVLPGTEPMGVPVIDTENREIKGNLTYNNITQDWSSLDNDIGWVLTPSGVDNYVIVRFQIDFLPIGYIRNNSYGQSTFIPWAQATGTQYFRTRSHIISVSPGTYEFDSENLILSIYNITAKTDYNDATYDGTIDWYQIHEKEVPAFMTDIRSASCRIYTREGVASNVPPLGLNDLYWDTVEEYWYVENLDLSTLPGGRYYLGVRFQTLNINLSSNTIQQVTDIFQIKGETPIYIYILPACFLIGLIVVPIVLYVVKIKKSG
ncbi:MAG: hypothetical protein GPJ52_03395 [Candidatus Heimdallarchaeota archaeon]|nr:hypothetical protein [Candidatus Heimdallarchaeota archaeon]